MAEAQPSQPRVLVAYATFAGSTCEVAAAIGRTLARHGYTVDVLPVTDPIDLEPYAAVVLGSAIQHGQWLPEALEFVNEQQAALKRVPVALFAVHLTNRGRDEKSRHARLAYLDAARALVKPVDEAFFAGRFDRRGAARLRPGLLAHLVPPVDLRNWKEISGWARRLAARLDDEFALRARASASTGLMLHAA